MAAADVALALPRSLAGAAAEPARALAEMVAAGQYVQALDQPLAHQLLGAGPASAAARVREHVEAIGDAADKEAAAVAVTMLAAAALSLFAQLNWTGPPLGVGESFAHRLSSSTEMNAAARDALAAENEQVYALVQAPSLLWAAQSLLVDPLEALQGVQAGGWLVSWWAARCTLLRQQILEQRTVSLEKLATRCMRTVIESMTRHAAAAGTLAPETSVMVVGLEARPELNGRRGTVVSFDEAKGRYGVSVEGGGSMLLKRDNLLVSAIDTHLATTWSRGAEEADAAREAVAVAQIEMAHLLLFHRKVAQAEHAMDQATSAIGVNFSLAGALGKRTKHQENEISQLTLHCKLGDLALPRPAELDEEWRPLLPRRVEEEDDTLLNRLQLSDDVTVPALRPLEQALLLLHANVLRASRPAVESTREEMEPFIDLASREPQSWAIHTQALRLKARLESEQKRRRHRSLMQLQSLVDDFTPHLKDSLLNRHLGVQAAESDEPTELDVAALQRVAQFRMAAFWSVTLAPSWHLRAELARTMAALGLITEATSMFESLELWDEFVAAMLATNQKERADSVIRERISQAPTPAMYCYLGDLTGEQEHYETAWSLSEGRCARAKLALGAAQMKAEAWTEARAQLKQALEVKPHYAEAAYCCGVCALKLHDSAGAMSDFRRVVALDPTHFQAWSNLGVLFNKENQKKEALFAFKEACRLRSDSWQLWGQQAVTAAELGYFEQSLFCLTMANKAGGPPNGPVSSLCAQAVAKDVKDAIGNRSRRLLPRMRELLSSNTTQEPTEQRHWETRLFLERECGSRAELRAVHKEQVWALRASTKWKSDPQTLDTFAEVVAQLVELQLESGEEAELIEAKKTVDELVYQASEKLMASVGCEALKMLQMRLNRHLDD